MDFLTKLEMDKMHKENSESDFMLDLDKMRIERCLKSDWAKEIDAFFSDVECSGRVISSTTKKCEMPKRNFWQRLKYLFTGK